MFAGKVVGIAWDDNEETIMKRFARPWIALGWAAMAAFAAWAAAADKPAEESRPAVAIEAAKYPSLQAAFDALPEAGGLVKLPPGEFRITQPLVISRGNTRVEGAGTATRIVNCGQKGEPALIVRPGDLAKNPRARLWRVQLADFRVNGDPNTVNDKSTSPKSGDGIVFQNIDELYVHGMTVDHNGGHGIHLIACVEDPRIADSIIEYNRQAGLNVVGGHDTVVNANHFEENQDAVRFLDGFNLTMNGNNIDDHLGHGVVIENTYGSVLSGNMIEECNGTAVILDRDCYGITISANVIAHNAGGGVELRDAWGCAVSANTFTLEAKQALVVGPQSGRIAITGNNFCNSFVGPKVKFEGPASGVELEGTSDVTICGNVFSGLIGPAVQARGVCQRIAVTGNVLVDLNLKTTPPRPALDLPQLKESVVDHNVVGRP